jgi:hypothetical protein
VPGDRVEIRPQVRDLLFRAEDGERVAGAVVVHLDRQEGGRDAERGEQVVGTLVGLDGRQRLGHPAEDDPARLVPLQLDRDDATPGLERDRAELERGAEDEGRAQARVPGEVQLVLGREDADPDRSALPRREDEDRLGQTELESQSLHRHLVEVASVGEDGELVPG